MIMKVDDEKIKDVVNHWGDKMPMMVMEECGELIQAISKMERKGTLECENNLKEEIRDVYISLVAAQQFYQIYTIEINEMINSKLNMKKDK